MLNRKNWKLLGWAAAGLLGLSAGITLIVDPTYVKDHEPKSSPTPVIHDYYATDLPGQSGFEEYYREKHADVPKAVKAGQAVCSDISIIGYAQTKDEVHSQAENPQDAEDLLYASVHYLCPQYTDEMEGKTK